MPASLAGLLRLLVHRPPTRSEQRELAGLEPGDAAWTGIRTQDGAVIEAGVQDRLRLLRALGQHLPPGHSHPDRWPDSMLATAWRLWLPLSDRLRRRLELQERWSVGIQGPVGSGKSTGVRVLAAALAARGISSADLSLDDLYHPAGVGPPRGPPGSHDLSRGLRVLRDFEAGMDPLRLPRFDKEARGGAGDRVPDRELPRARVLLFEGWFVGSPVPSAYRPLWEELKELWVIRAPSVDLIRRWRHDAEEPRRRVGRGLSPAQVDALLDRMMEALPPEVLGSITSVEPTAAGVLPPRPEIPEPPRWIPLPSLLVDLAPDRTPWAILPGPGG